MARATPMKSESPNASETQTNFPQDIIANRSVAELDALIEAAVAMREELKAKARTTVLQEIEVLLKNAGMSLTDLKPPSTPAMAKYRFPSGATWAGRGKSPNEAKAAKERGELEKYRIREDGTTLADQEANEEK